LKSKGIHQNDNNEQAEGFAYGYLFGREGSGVFETEKK